MKIDSLYIENFKSIESAQIKEIDNAFILVGKNNTGKSSVIDAVRAVLGEYTIRRDNFRDNTRDVVIRMTLSEELDASDHVLIRQVTYVVTPDGRYYYEDEDGMSEKMPEYLPRLYYIDHRRNLREFQSALLDLQGDASITMLKEKKCPYQNDRTCDECFQCIPEIEKKTGAELTVFETAKLMEYRMYKMNLDKFSDSVNKYLKKNGMVGYQIRYEVDLDIDSMLNFDTVVYQKDREVKGTLSMMGAGSKSIYLLSLLEAYVEENSQDGGIIMIEDPEIFLHPQLQKTASEILYRLSIFPLSSLSRTQSKGICAAPSRPHRRCLFVSFNISSAEGSPVPPGLRTALRGCRSPRWSGVPFPAGCPRRRPAETPPALGCRRPDGPSASASSLHGGR